MKLALINPPSPFLINERVFPNTGLVRVATNLKREHKVKLFDFAGDKNYLESVNRMPRFDAYLFSSTTPQFPYTHKIFQALKKRYPDAHYTLGGAHASALYNLRQKGSLKDGVKIDNGSTVKILWVVNTMPTCQVHYQA